MSENQPTAAKPAYRGGLSADDVKDRVKVDTIYKLGSNEGPLGPSPAAIDAIQRVAASLGQYPPQRDDKLRESLTALHGRGLTPEHIVTGNSGCEVLELIARGYLDADSEAIICPPAFPVYKLTAEAQEATLVNIPLKRPDFTFDLEGIVSAVTDKTRVVYLTSPNNPTGSTLNADEVAYLVDKIPDTALIVFDEVYYHFVNEENRPDAISYVLDEKNFIILHSFSKAYGLAGLRLGYGIAKTEIAAKLSGLRRPYHLNRFAFEAGIAAIEDQDHIHKTVELTLTGRAWLYGQLQELGVQVWPSQGNFILFAVGQPPKEVADKLIERGVIVRPAFGLPDCLRVSVGIPEANQAFVTALGEILEEYHG